MDEDDKNSIDSFQEYSGVNVFDEFNIEKMMELFNQTYDS